MEQLNSWQLVALVLGAVVLGAFVTLLVQWAISVRELAREATRTSRQVTELVESLKPVMTRVNRLSAIVEDSEPDVRRVQLALHHFSEASVQLTDSLARVSGWVAMATPLLVTAFERWSHADKRDEAEAQPAPHPQPVQEAERNVSHATVRGSVANGGPAVVYPPV